MNVFFKAAIAGVFAWVSVGSANAADLLLSYRFASTGKTASVILTGNLANDGNRFVATGYSAYSVDGVPVTVGPFMDSADRAYGAPDASSTLPIVTLDGSFLDFMINDGTRPDFVLSVGNFVADVYNGQTGYPGGAAGAQSAAGGNGPSSRNGFEDFVRARYSATLVGSAVPEPETWALMVAGFGALGFAMRRRGAVRRPSIA